MALTRMHNSNPQEHDPDVVLGVHFPNSIFDEDANQRGFSYILDHQLYIALSDELARLDKAKVRCFTNYGYSSFLISTPQRYVNDVYLSAEKILINMDFDASATKEELAQWIASQSLSAKYRKSRDCLYYQSRLGDNPLSRPMAQGLLTPTGEELATWHNRCNRREFAEIVVSGPASAEAKACEQRSQYVREILQFSPAQVALPNHIPWRCTSLVLAVPVKMQPNNVLACEAFCQWIRPAVSAVANSFGGRHVSVRIFPDHFTELRLCLQCTRGKERQLIDNILGALRSLDGHLLEETLPLLQEYVKNSYYNLENDRIAWNRFVGYNAFSGRKYDISRLLDEEIYQEQITAENLQGIFQAVAGFEKWSVFAAPVS